VKDVKKGRQMDIKPIETNYRGYRFRSRLEARWACFLTTLGIDYEYEPNGYNLGELGRYLPDFWVPSLQSYVEIKPELAGQEKCRGLSDMTGKAVVLIAGQPWPREHRIGFFHPKGTGFWDFGDYAEEDVYASESEAQKRCDELDGAKEED
jgi:hypothetical protein